MLKNGNLTWGPSQHEAFERLKHYLENLTVLTSPTPKAHMLLYIVASESAVSAVLVEERNIEGTVRQVLIYFVSEAIASSKLFYSKMEKLAYTIVIAKHKLRQYFEFHCIIIPTSHPLKDIVRNRESLTQIAK